MLSGATYDKYVAAALKLVAAEGGDQAHMPAAGKLALMDEKASEPQPAGLVLANVLHALRQPLVILLCTCCLLAQGRPCFLCGCTYTPQDSVTSELKVTRMISSRNIVSPGHHQCTVCFSCLGLTGQGAA